MLDKITSLEELKAHLRPIAAKECVGDDPEEWCPYDWASGNFDDCFEQGRHSGRVNSAREILALLGE